MKRIFRVTILLFAFLFVCACSNEEKIYNAKIVSSVSDVQYVVSDEAEEVLEANVMIFNNCYSSLLGFKYKENNSYGSGVIYKSDENYYYVLTNNHVVSYDVNYDKQDLILEDYYLNRYEAEVVYSDVSYDLAVIRFEKNIDLAVLNINDDKISIRENVRSMGNPDSVKNVINDGEINCFSYVTLNNEKSKVDFEVIVHSAQISSGSSGGALLDSNNNIIGITFAGVFDNEGDFITGYAIPSYKIIEFLNK